MEAVGLTRTWDELTDRQQEVLTAFVEFLFEHRVPPTLRDMAKVLDVNHPNGVVSHFSPLERYGWLECREEMTSRSWRLTPRALSHFRIVKADEDKVAVNLITPQMVLTPAEARELADQLNRAAYIAEGRQP